MRLLTIAAGEWKGRRLLWFGAVFVALMMLLAPLPGAHIIKDQTLQERWATAAMGLSLMFSSVLAVFLGASMLNRDLREGRAGFFFALPMHPLELFLGKLLGAWFLCLSTGALILAPALVLTWQWELLKAFEMLATLSLLLLLIAHVFFFIVSARTLWCFLDWASLMAAAGIGWLWLHRLQAVREVNLDKAILGGAGVLLVALLVASCIQMMSGRVDLARGHRALSLTLVACVGVGAMGAWVYTRLAQRTSWGAFSHVVLCRPAPKGPWVGVLEEQRHCAILNTETGKGLSLAPLGSVAFSSDGSRIAWVAISGFTSAEVWTAKLAGDASEVRPTGLSVSLAPWVAHVVLSPTGRRVGLWEDHRLKVVDLSTEEWREIELPVTASNKGSQFFFVSDDVVRCCWSSEGEKGGFEIREWDLRSGVDRRTGSSSIHVEWPLLDRNVQQDRMLVRGTLQGNTGLWLCEGRTGAVLKDFSVHTSHAAAAFLQDGSLVLAQEMPQGIQVSHCTPEGEDMWHQTIIAAYLPPVFLKSSGLWWQTEEAPGRLQLIYHRGSKPAGIIKVDVKTRTLQDDPTPFLPFYGLGEGPAARLGDLARRLQSTPSGGLSVRLADGSSKTLVEGRSGR